LDEIRALTNTFRYDPDNGEIKKAIVGYPRRDEWVKRTQE
jgi:hypothetical protein